ncbi:MAG: hypothetical protein K9G67_14230 [Bacteroidales bacterium]|nr:hypothetical protein [Bacteroidales bacterium]MCF8377511.1 hypothetical protein [Bacteroidales bacterium]MCF8401822.1 hypothetical protein [Bacteroidales bacterium]
MNEFPKYLIMGILFLLMSSCSGNANEKETVSKTETETGDANHAAIVQKQNTGKVYEIESGYVKYKSKASGFDLITERWFDNYGALQYEESYLVIAGEKSGSSTLIRDGSRYTWGFDNSEGQCFKNYKAPRNSYDELTQREIDRYGIKIIGEEEVMGRMCQKLSTEKPAKTLQWIWKGLALKSVSEFGKQEIFIDVVELNEGDVDASRFVMPDGIVFQDM